VPEERNDAGREEHHQELIELLNELRVALPGVQVLFAFLLTVPFSARFTTLTELQRDIYYVAFLGTAFASGFLMAPTSYHRIRWRQADKEQMLRTANRFAILGTALLAVSVGAVVFLISDILFGARLAALFTAPVAAFLAWAWFGLPLFRRARDGDL
jgi:uncharacterized membrane protein